MDRRDFLKTTSAAAAAAAATGSTAIAAEPAPQPAPASVKSTTTLSVGLMWADAVFGPGDDARRLLKEIEAATSGRYRFEISQTTPSTLQSIANGDADIVLSSPDTNYADAPALAFFSGLPGEASLDGTQLQNWLKISGGQELWDEQAEQFAAKSLLVGHLGPNPAIWSARAINEPGDVTGLRIAIDGLAADVARGAGALPVAPSHHASARSASDALASGQIDAAQLGGNFTALQASLPQSGKVATTSGFCNAGSTVALSFSRRVWDGMSDADRLLISALCDRAYQTSLAEHQAHEAIARDVAITVHDIAFAPLPPETASVIKRVSDAMLAHVASSSPLAGQINAGYMAFRRTVGDATQGKNQTPIA